MSRSKAAETIAAQVGSHHNMQSEGGGDEIHENITEKATSRIQRARTIDAMDTSVKAHLCIELFAGSGARWSRAASPQVCPFYEQPIQGKQRYLCAESNPRNKELSYTQWTLPIPGCNQLKVSSLANRSLWIMGDSISSQHFNSLQCRIIRELYGEVQCENTQSDEYCHNVKMLGGCSVLNPGYKKWRTECVKACNYCLYHKYNPLLKPSANLLQESIDPQYRAEKKSKCPRRCFAVARWHMELCYFPSGHINCRNISDWDGSGFSRLQQLADTGRIPNRTIIVLNEGLHSIYDIIGQPSFNARSRQFNQLAKALTRTNSLLLWRETSPQAFDTPAGDGGFAPPLLRKTCTRPRDMTNNLKNRWANAAAMVADVPVLKIWYPSALQWDSHVANWTEFMWARAGYDCTHWCQPSGVFEAWTDLLILHTAASGHLDRFQHGGVFDTTDGLLSDFSQYSRTP